MSKARAPARRKGPICVLCDSKLEPSPLEGVLAHPVVTFCSVRLTDDVGISIDEIYELGDDGVVYELLSEEEAAKRDAETAEAMVFAEPSATPVEVSIDDLLGIGSDFVIMLDEKSPYLSAEAALSRIFTEAGVPRLGGASGDRGWSSFSTYQKCPHLWKTRYQDTDRGLVQDNPKSPSLEIGTIVHAFQAIMLAKKMDIGYPLEPEQVRDQMLMMLVTPEYVHEGWRVFRAYLAYYTHDAFEPLAVEHLLVDPRTRQSCRIDALMWLEESEAGFPRGAYIFDFKTAARFDFATLNGWKNDGEIIGLFDLYERTKAHKRFGKLQGIIVDIIGKQKVPNFHRTFVNPSRGLIKDHRKSLQIWSAAIETSVATGVFPRARAACVGRYGFLCDEYDRCTQEQVDE